MKKTITVFLNITLFLLLGISRLYAVNPDIAGHVLDETTKEPLYGANVILMGTSLGVSTNIDGEYKINNVLPGSYTLRITYIGYLTKETKIEVKDGINFSSDFTITPVGIVGEEVTVLAQAEGQNQAINQQLSSDKIINVVSKAKIEELPDANAAESVGRLPGVTVLRSGGEGDRIVIRGLEPKFNAITVNGVKLSGSTANDRGADLSMISSNMLEGIQVSKTVTPDMDANVVGGVVNFELREARVKTPGVPEFSFITQGAYNGLPNAVDKLSNYKFVATLEDRIFDNTFGFFVQGSYERRNLSSNELGASYGPVNNNDIDYQINNITLDNFRRDRKRGNGVLSLDYIIPDGKIISTNLFSTSTTEGFDRQQFYNLGGINNQSFTANYSKGTLNSVTNMLGYEQELWIFKVKANISHSYSETKSPKDWTVTFLTAQGGTGINQFSGKSNLEPKDIITAAKNDTAQTSLQTMSTNYTFTRERILSGSLDFETPINFSDLISTVIKFGVKYQYQTRSNDVNVSNGEQLLLSSGVPLVNHIKAGLPWVKIRGNSTIPMSSFIDEGFDYGEFLNGDYKLIYPLDFSKMQMLMDYVNANQLPNNISYNYNVGASITNDYWGKEDIKAAYIMANINVGSFLNIIPGVRFQQLKTVYTGVQGLQGPNAFSVYPNRLVTYTKYHPYLLPDLLIRIKPIDWCDIRLAYTNTISYPDYVSLPPRINVATSTGFLQWNGFKLDPIKSQNYDIYFSLYNNTVGLFTAGAFLKQVSNLIYPYNTTPITAAELGTYYPDWVTPKPRTPGTVVNTYINHPYKLDNYGMELDWQTHFWYLPGPLSGLVLSANYTHIFSKAEYPIQKRIVTTIPNRNIDTSYTAPLLYQPDNILNVTLGYDYKRFSIRISSLYSAKIFTGPNPRPQLLAYTSAYNRWDISVKQALPYFEGFEVFCNMNNINGAEDESVISAPTSVPNRIQKYDYMIEIGLRGEF